MVLKKLLPIMALAGTLALLGGIALATIPDSAGLIHGCYKSSGPAKGALIVIDSDAGDSCPTGTIALSWNQTGPQGPAGSSAQIDQAHVHVYRVSATITVAPSSQTTFDVACDGELTSSISDDDVAISGGWKWDPSQVQNSAQFGLVYSHPDVAYAGSYTRWHFSVWSSLMFAIQIEAFALCLDLPPLRT